jgi:hypothetical protein
MDNLTDASEEEEVMPPLMDDLEVNVPDFPHLQGIPQFQVEEVQVEDLVDFDDLAPNPQKQIGGFENIHLGFVHTFTPPVAPAPQKACSSVGPVGLSPDAVRLWAKYFSTVDQSLPTVTIPMQWMNFFTMLLLKQSSIYCAKEFLQSPAWQTIIQNNSGNFSLLSFLNLTFCCNL